MVSSERRKRKEVEKYNLIIVASVDKKREKRKDHCMPPSQYESSSKVHGSYNNNDQYLYARQSSQCNACNTQEFVHNKGKKPYAPTSLKFINTSSIIVTSIMQSSRINQLMLIIYQSRSPKYSKQFKSTPNIHKLINRIRTTNSKKNHAQLTIKKFTIII